MSRRIDFYETYYKNVSPTTFEVKRSGDKIIIEGFDKKYPKNFKPKDVKQYPVNQEKFNNGGLISPNGRKSNLTAKQYKLVRTKQFKNWFGDWELNPNAASKVVDENGEPLVCYHSTDKKFTSFDSNYSFDGFWFTESKTKLLNQEAGAGGQGIIYDVFLNIRNIGDWDDYDKGLDIVKRDGYNGVKLDDDFLVFEPTQIKFANGSNTRFDPNNPDIRYEQGGKTQNDMKEIKVGDSVIPYGYKFTLIISEGWKNVLGQNVWKGTSKNGNYQLAFVESGKDTIVKNNNSTYAEGGEVERQIEQMKTSVKRKKKLRLEKELEKAQFNGNVKKIDSTLKQLSELDSTYAEGGKTKTWKNKYNSKYDHPKDERDYKKYIIKA